MQTCVSVKKQCKPMSKQYKLWITFHNIQAYNLVIPTSFLEGWENLKVNPRPKKSANRFLTCEITV